MNTKLLLQWLDLPAGNWPPEHRLLLGLTLNQPLDPNLVEQRALEQMEKLRPHQIMHPDLVTEGMTRLAQAMIALSEPPSANRISSPSKSTIAKSAITQAPSAPTKTPSFVDSALLLPKKIEAPRPSPDPAQEMILDAEKLIPQKPNKSSKSTTRPPAPVILDAELVQKPKSTKQTSPRTLLPTVHHEALLADESAPQESGPVRAVAVPPSLARGAPPGLVYLPKDRRRAYQQIVALRRFKEAWQELKPFLGSTSELLATPVRVLEFSKAAQKCRLAVVHLESLDFLDNRQMGIVSMMHHPLARILVRELLPNQRKELAISWSLGVQLLEQQYAQARNQLNQTKPRRRIPQFMMHANQWLRDNPEWWLSALLFACWVLAILRVILVRSS